MKKTQILIVGQSNCVLKLKTLFIEYTVISPLLAFNGKDALKAIKEEKPCILIVDEKTNEIHEGSEFLKKINSDPSMIDIPVIMLMNEYGSDKTTRISVSRFNDCIKKPVNKSDFFNKVSRYIRILVRKHARAPLHTKVSYFNEGKEFNGEIFYIGEGGMFIMSENAFQVGSHMKFIFAVSDIIDNVEAYGDVVWTTSDDKNKYPAVMSPGMGIQFTDLNNKARDAIATYICRRGDIT